MMAGMITSKTNNDRLRELVEESGLSQHVALTVFNRGLGVAACSVSAWKAFLSSAEATWHRPLKDELLAHAEQQFSRLGRRR